MALTLSVSLHAEEGSIVSKERPVDVDAKFEESYFQTKPWINEFHYVIVVNKADEGKEAQSIKVYEFGKLITQDKVSTGRDEFEAKGEHHSKRDSWSVTPTGYYTPSFLDKDHKSSAYGGIFSKIIGGVKMPFAIFFNGDIALHQAPKGTEGALGTKASGGCIRLPESVASDLFTRVSETQGAHNPRFTVAGEAMLDNDGHLMHSTNAGFSALVIVLKKVTE
jgi:hypothetical protein